MGLETWRPGQQAMYKERDAGKLVGHVKKHVSNKKHSDIHSAFTTIKHPLATCTAGDE